MLVLDELAVPGNAPLLLWLASQAGHFDPILLRASSALFDPRLFPLHAAACAWLRSRQHRPAALSAAAGGWRDLLYCLFCFTLAIGLVGAAKVLVQAPRPALLLAEVVPQLAAGDPYSFPSGHAAAAAALACLLWARAGSVARAVLVLLLAWVMATRCIAGLHFPLDVATGAALSCVACAAAARLRDRFVPRHVRGSVLPPTR